MSILIEHGLIENMTLKFVMILNIKIVIIYDPLNNMICDENAKLMNVADVAFTNKSLCQRIMSQWYKSCDLKEMSLNIELW